MTPVRKLLDMFDDDGPRVFDPRGRRIRGRTPWERAAIAEARQMSAAGRIVGKVSPPPVAAALDLERLAAVTARLRRLLAEVDASRLDDTPTMRARIEAAEVALEAIHNEPAPIDLDQLP
jgi:hypothetical protein